LIGGQWRRGKTLDDGLKKWETKIQSVGEGNGDNIGVTTGHHGGGKKMDHIIKTHRDETDGN